MSRLEEERRRLFGNDSGSGDAADITPATTRVLVLELARPAAWQPLAAVWQGVQADLAWPAPAIAVNGVDGLQLWFSLTEPVPAAQAQQAVAALCARYLAGLSQRRLAAWPPTSELARPQTLEVPAHQAASGGWSAFVAPDLAAIFEDTPWLDLQPGVDAQASLLMAGRSLTPAQWRAGLATLAGPAALAEPQQTSAASTSVPAPAPNAAVTLARDFLLQVMQDEAAPLAQRIEAARALLAAG
jgi:hypothetical protein